VIRVGVVGAGVMGSNHIRVLAKADWVDEVLVFDDFQLVKPESQKVRQLDSLTSLLEIKPSYVVVSTPTSTHLDVASLCAQYGVPTLIEKPVATTLEDAKKIEDAFSRANLSGWIGFVERFNPAAVALRSKLQEGAIGQLLQITTKRVGPNPVRIGDVGVVLDLASHDIDLVHWLTGENYLEQSSQLLKVFGSKHEFSFLGIAKLNSGVTVSHEVNWISPRKTRQVTLIGDKGTLVADLLNAELRLYKNGVASSEWEMYKQLRGISEGEMVQFVVPVREPLGLEHEAIFNDLKNNQNSELCSIAEGVRNLEVVERFVHD
jgi:UDP-N-acetylglucosamine 3-dehydrogenase